MSGMKQEKAITGLLTALTAVLVAVSTVFLVKKTGFAAALTSSETRTMLFELLIVFTLLFISAWHPVQRWLSHLLRFLVIAGFLWLHQALLPVLAAGLYLVYLCLLGSLVTGRMFSGKPTGPAGFIAGASAQILIVCGFSAAGIGGTMFFLIQSSVCFLALIILKFIAVKKTGHPAGALVKSRKMPEDIFSGYRKEKKFPKDRSRLIFCLLMALIGTSLLLQAGRLGICLDYDSLHYGFRSAYVLDNGYGIYENLGSVNDVYVYPKGFEILTLPLAGFGSGAFVSAFSWWMTAVTLSAAAALVNRLASRRTGSGRVPAGLFAAAVICTVPGVMNMAVSAKTDAVTLAVQTVIVLCFLSSAKSDWWVALAAAFLSLTLKPTAFLFSFLLTAAGLGLCAYRLQSEHKNSLITGRTEKYTEAAGGDPAADTERERLFTLRGLLPAMISLAAAAAVLLRTVHLAGVPLTTAGGGLWTALGFGLKYPFNGVSFGGGTEKNFLKRLIGVFACPAGEDMSHVYIAWGGLTVTVCLAVTLVGTVSGRRKRNAAKNGLLIMLLLVTAASLFLIRTLWQVDGNYFMLLYVLAAVSAFTVTAGGTGRPGRLVTILAPAMLFGIVLCMVTNWAGVKGLTTVKLLHKGYPETQKEQQLQMTAEGKGEIYSFLAENPRNRVLAMADQPGCFAFPCNVQSYTDLEGSGGNVAILKTLDEFRDFLDYAGTEYIYVEQTFIDSRSRASEIVGYMLEDGSLEEVLLAEEAGAALYRYTGAR